MGDSTASTSGHSSTYTKETTSNHNANTNRVGGLDMTNPESIAVILEFLSLVCSEGKMRDWLGKEGSGFWLHLLRLLCERPIENPSIYSASTNMNLSYAKLETATIKFLSKCCWCHQDNQDLLAELLTEVIIQQNSPGINIESFKI